MLVKPGSVSGYFHVHRVLSVATGVQLVAATSFSFEPSFTRWTASRRQASSSFTVFLFLIPGTIAAAPAE
jgi:hypothetical protein